MTSATVRNEREGRIRQRLPQIPSLGRAVKTWGEGGSGCREKYSHPGDYGWKSGTHRRGLVEIRSDKGSSSGIRRPLISRPILSLKFNLLRRSKAMGSPKTGPGVKRLPRDRRQLKLCAMIRARRRSGKRSKRRTRTTKTSR